MDPAGEEGSMTYAEAEQYFNSMEGPSAQERMDYIVPFLISLLPPRLVPAPEAADDSDDERFSLTSSSDSEASDAGADPAAFPPAAPGDGEDHIGRLPDAVLSDIISRLPTKEAARTVVLSTRWRDAWRGTPLCLDDLELPTSLPAPSRVAPTGTPWAARADAVTRALASHPGPVARFRLSRTTLRARVPAAEAWFLDLAAAKPAREVSLLCPPEWCHLALADPLLACPTLETLALGECRFSDAGAAAASASRLTELTLSSTHISEVALQSVLSGCPALRSVILRHLKGPHRIRVTSCRSLVLLGVWQYKRLQELTVEDAPRLERLSGDVHLGAAVTIIGAPKLTALGYLVVGVRDIFHGLDKPADQEKVAKGLRAPPIHNVKILAISVTFSIKKDMEKVMGLLKCFPCLETLHIQGESEEGKDDTIGSDYYQKLDPIGCVVNHLKSVRLESIFESHNMLECAFFLLQNAQVLQIMRIQSAMFNSPAWVTEQQNLLSQCHMASLEAKVVFEGMKVIRRKGFNVEAVNALPDPFDSDIEIMGY